MEALPFDPALTKEQMQQVIEYFKQNLSIWAETSWTGLEASIRLTLDGETISSTTIDIPECKYERN